MEWRKSMLWKGKEAFEEVKFKRIIEHKDIYLCELQSLNLFTSLHPLKLNSTILNS